MLDKNAYDFGCWVIKYCHSNNYGITYRHDSMKNNDGIIVPLLWNHQHNNPAMVLGQALLKHRDDGIYTYFKLFDNDVGEKAKEIVLDQDTHVFISPFITSVKFDKNNVVSGSIREVSLTLARIDPDDIYRPVLINV